MWYEIGLRESCQLCWWCERLFFLFISEYLFDVLSLLVLLAVVLLLAKCEKLLLLLLLQLRQPLAALLVQLTQLLVQGPERLLRSTAGINTHTHTPCQHKLRSVGSARKQKLFRMLQMHHVQIRLSTSSLYLNHTALDVTSEIPNIGGNTYLQARRDWTVLSVRLSAPLLEHAGLEDCNLCCFRNTDSGVKDSRGP